MPAVVDASPVIVLAKAGLLTLLRLTGDPVAIPNVVVQEIQRGGPNDPTVQALPGLPWLVPVDPGPDDSRLGPYPLHVGEAGVLTWALQHPGMEAILDDASARHCAVQLGVPVRGCVGLMIEAKHVGVLSLARPALDDLRRVGLHLSDHIMQRALRLVGE